MDLNYRECKDNGCLGDRPNTLLLIDIIEPGESGGTSENAPALNSAG